ncbi:hypothetical protein ACTG21_05795 [Aeromonas sp. 94A]|uniref:hypothetical protein n=1 Tax=Aeromonas sp. 94A TaxID=3452728 RepID=UPI003F7A6D1F
MRILIYGEFSGYGKSLAVGFRQLGHEACVFSPSGDGWKNLDSELKLSSKTKIGKLFDLVKLIPSFMKYEIIYIMNPSFFSFKLLGPVILMLFKIYRKEIYLLCCGDDVEYIRSGESGGISKYIFHGVNYPSSKYFKRIQDRIVNYLCATFSKKIIPTMYDYERPWKTSYFSNKVTDVVPLACAVNSDASIKATDVNSIKIMHGINRKDVKGTDVILMALKKIEENYNNVVVYTPERLGQSEYLKLFSNIDISIDQCKCHSYGMNAIYAMLHGHIVLAPADKHHCKSFDIDIDSCPVVSISNDVDVIYKKIQELLELSPQDMDYLKVKTQRYARDFHRPESVCRKLTALW